MSKEKPEENTTPEENAEKLFKEDEYAVIKVELADAKSPLKDDNFVKTLLNLLDSGNPDDKESALDLLKKEDAVDYLLEAIKTTQNSDKKAVLLAACWESGLSFKDHHNFFLEYAFNINPLVSLEAITVLDSNRMDIPKEAVQPLVDKLSAAIEKNHDNAALLEDLKQALEDQLKAE